MRGWVTRSGRALLASLVLLACDAAPVPAAIELRVSPPRTWYHTGQTIQLNGVVTDAAGAEIEGVEVAFEVDPPGMATEGAPLPDPRSATFTLGAEGRATFTACVPSADPEVPPTLCDSVTVRIDDGMPALEVETPTPGAQLDAPDGIVVRASVADRSMVNVYVDGTPATVDAMGRFEGTVEASFGVNHIVVSATDGLTDASEVEMDVLWAPEYTPALGADGEPSVAFDDGLSIWLGQRFFDDEVPIDTTARPVTTRDLADVLELVIGRLDPGSLVPDPVVDSPPTFTLRVPDVRVGAPHVEIDLTDDGADLFIRVGRIEADTSGALMVDTTSLPLTGTISGSAVAFAHLTIRKDGPDAPLDVSVGDLSVGLERLEGDFVSPETTAVFRLAEGLLRTTLETALVDALSGTLESSVPGVLRDALGAIDTALADQSIDLASGPFPPVTLLIDGRIRTLRSTFRRDLTATLSTRVGTTSPATFPETRGVPRLTTLPALPFVDQGSLQLGVRLALLNGLLHSLWASGLLDIDASSVLPDSISGLVSEARIVGRMQPILRPPRADETDALVLSIGQLELELTFMDEPVRFGMNIEAGVNIDLSDNRIAVQIADEPTLHVWTLQAPSNPRLLTPATIETLLTDLWPDLRDSVAGGLGFDLPLPSLGDLGGLAPELAGLRLSLGGTEPLRLRRGVLVLGAEMSGTLP